MNFPMHKTKAFTAPDDEDKIEWVHKVKTGIQIHPGNKCCNNSFFIPYNLILQIFFFFLNLIPSKINIDNNL